MKVKNLGVIQLPLEVFQNDVVINQAVVSEANKRKTITKTSFDIPTLLVKSPSLLFLKQHRRLQHLFYASPIPFSIACLSIATL